MRTRLATCAVLLAAGLAPWTSWALEPVASTQHFAFYSNLDTNLNDALIVAGRDRQNGRQEQFHSGEAKDCFAGLAPSRREGWNLAVDYYQRIISPAGWTDRQQYLLRIDLAGIEEELDDNAAVFLDLASHMRDAAKPAYVACAWERQDAQNRTWVERLLPRLEAHETAIGERLEAVYGTPWHGLPLRADVVAHAPPVGANTIWLSPAGGHVLVSSTIADELALEIMFHEASHTLFAAGRGDPWPLALEGAAKELSVDLPRDLWHVVLFYLTGESICDMLADDCTPYMVSQGLWDGRWGQYRQAVEATLPAYLEGKADIDGAARALLRALPEQATD